MRDTRDWIRRIRATPSRISTGILRRAEESPDLGYTEDYLNPHRREVRKAKRKFRKVSRKGRELSGDHVLDPIPAAGKHYQGCVARDKIRRAQKKGLPLMCRYHRHTYKVVLLRPRLQDGQRKAWVRLEPVQAQSWYRTGTHEGKVVRVRLTSIFIPQPEEAYLPKRNDNG